MIDFLSVLLSFFHLYIPTQLVHTFDDSSLLSVEAPYERNLENIAPVIYARAALVMDLDTSDILYKKNINEPIPIASLTKLMSALVIVDELAPDKVLEVLPDSLRYNANGGSVVGLRIGQKMDVNNLLHASLIRSGNDATTTLAIGDAGTIEDFVKKMNERAVTLGLHNTHFANPVGFDDTNNYSTAYELALIAKQAFRRPLIREILTKQEFTLRNSGGSVFKTISNTNDLFRSYLHVIGGKTGTTPWAGQCLFFVVKNDQGHEILTVLLNSPNRYREAKLVTDWVFRTYKWSSPQNATEFAS